MAPKRIKIFVTVKKYLALVGFGENNSAFDRRFLINGVLGILAMILLLVHLFHVASTAREYMESIVMTMAGVVSFIAYISMHFQYANIFILINEFEEAINDSEYIVIAPIPEEEHCSRNTDKFIIKFIATN